MRVKDIVDENFQDYKQTSMFICTISCGGKCWRELGLDCSICQNDKIQKQEILNISDEKIIQRYLNNPITKAIIIGGLEPFEQYEEMFNLICRFRAQTKDPIIIKRFKNIIIKFGRYIPNNKPRYDEVLGITLASQNQYAKKIS